MTVEELREAAQPFHPDTGVYAKMGSEYHPIWYSTYMHDDEGHLILVIEPTSLGKEGGQ